METNMTTTREFLLTLIDDMEEIAGNWNGEDSGTKEDDAMSANDAIEKIKELLEILTELGY